MQGHSEPTAESQDKGRVGTCEAAVVAAATAADQEHPGTFLQFRGTRFSPGPTAPQSCLANGKKGFTLWLFFSAPRRYFR